MDFVTRRDVCVAKCLAIKDMFPKENIVAYKTLHLIVRTMWFDEVYEKDVYQLVKDLNIHQAINCSQAIHTWIVKFRPEMLEHPVLEYVIQQLWIWRWNEKRTTESALYAAFGISVTRAAHTNDNVLLRYPTRIHKLLAVIKIQRTFRKHILHTKSCASITIQRAFRAHIYSPSHEYGKRFMMVSADKWGMKS